MKVAVLVSGGVDSSVALALLEEQNHDVTAFYLKIWLDGDLSHLAACPWQEDLDYIREVCKLCNVKLHVIDMQHEYFDRVVRHAMHEVEAGRTPNPDMFCNLRIKFGLFLEKITGFDAVASGHYAQIVDVNGKPCLKQAPDPVKDQTYFLSQLPSEKLNHILFPVGSYTKKQVRQLAAEFALPNKDRKDSQGICFLGKFKYSQFLEHYLGTKPGNLIDVTSGKIVGQHQGFWYYTAGQRRGIGLPGGPWYVVRRDPQDNTVFISNAYHTQQSTESRKTFQIKPGNWFLYKPAGLLRVKLRHGPEFHLCSVHSDNVTLAEADQGIASGQFAAFYKDDLCIGSAEIN